jgi:hypothetical protein
LIRQEEEKTRAHLMRISPHGNTKRSREPEIRKLEVILAIDKQVLGLQIAMEDPVRMAVQQPRIELVQEFL